MPVYIRWKGRILTWGKDWFFQKVVFTPIWRIFTSISYFFFVLLIRLSPTTARENSISPHPPLFFLKPAFSEKPPRFFNLLPYRKEKVVNHFFLLRFSYRNTRTILHSTPYKSCVRFLRFFCFTFFLAGEEKKKERKKKKRKSSCRKTKTQKESSRVKNENRKKKSQRRNLTTRRLEPFIKLGYV